jgi:hypothetical protein
MRQLNETYFKYHQDLVEIHERLTFLIVQKTVVDSSQSSNNFITRLEGKIFANQIRHSQISITEEITELLNLKKNNNIKK